MLPIAEVSVEGVSQRALVDSGCSRSVAHISCCNGWRKGAVNMLTVSGEEWQCEGTGTVRLQVNDGAYADIDVIVTTVKPLGFSFLLGIDGIKALGGVTIDSQGKAHFGPGIASLCAACDSVIKVDEKDFNAIYDPHSKTWTAVWKWAEGREPDVLHNKVDAYNVSEQVREQYEEELQTWIQDGWLLPYDENKYGPAKGLVPLMAVVQWNKGKVRPVMDFREINSYIDTFTADADVCAEKLREWRKQGENVSVIDLRKAYLQIRIHDSMWPYQTVLFKGQRYCLTRLGFGLNVAPLVMKAVLNCVLSQDQNVRKGSSAYIDDIFVNEDIVGAMKVERHLEKFGLVCKPHERLFNGARVLGLRVWGEQRGLMWKRDYELNDVPEIVTRREVFSFCGKLVGHFPVCGWLRVATAFIKRKANLSTESWDEVIHNSEVCELMKETVDKVRFNDPVRGKWAAVGSEARVWTDASSLALGVALEIDGHIVEDASWLRKEDSSHINMAELDAVIKGLNLALAWKVKKVEILTDSSTVHRWIADGLSGKSRLRTKAASEMLIRRRVGIVMSLIEEYDIHLTVSHVSSMENKADVLTRVPQRWLKVPNDSHGGRNVSCAAAVDPTREEIAEIHQAAGHPGVKRTLYFVKRVYPAATRRLVHSVVTNCDICQSIDPAPAKWTKGALSVEETWQRVGMDVTHCNGNHYLTLIDCGPSRFAVWRRLRMQTSSSIIGQLQAVFYERGAPEELLTDNDTAFRSKLFKEFVLRWCVRLRFRCAHVPSGNGIIERCHRTVKVIAARKGCTIEEAVYLYNLRPQDDCTPTTAPANMIYQYPVRIRGVDPCKEDELDANCRYQAGDEVWVKPPNARCDDRYRRGKVTNVLSDQAVEVDGVPRHVRDLRCCSTQNIQCWEDSAESDESDELLIAFSEETEDAEEEEREEMEQVLPRRSSRVKIPRVVCNQCN